MLTSSKSAKAVMYAAFNTNTDRGSVVVGNDDLEQTLQIEDLTEIVETAQHARPDLLCKITRAETGEISTDIRQRRGTPLELLIAFHV